MKKLLSLLVVLVVLVSAIPCSADSGKVQEHLSSLDGLSLVDKISFDFSVDNSLEGIITDEVAEVGEKVNGKLEHYSVGSRNYYILTFSGNIDTISFWNVSYESLDSSNILSSNIPMTFSTCNRFENNSMLIYDILPDTFYFKGVFENTTLKSALLKYTPFTYNVVVDNSMSNAVECGNAVYEVIKEDNNNLSNEFQENNKETLIEEQIKKDEIFDVKEQDPERYITVVKGTRNDGKVSDYKITFVAEIPLDTFNSNVDWYKDLGENITATLVGFTQTIDGEEVRNYTMIRFVGSKKTVWFNNADTLPHNEKEDFIIVDNSYVSLISFDGVERVYNSVNHDTLDTQITFENNSTMELVSIKMIIGGKSVETKIDNIKYIGGGKATYEKLF